MYVPKHVNQNDAEKLAAFIDENAFGVLVRKRFGPGQADEREMSYQFKRDRLV